MCLGLGFEFVCVFFFKQKTAYEMRISDWSSDVCSSDLVARQWTGRRGSELLRDAEPDDARGERENVGGQAGIIRIEEGIRDRCRVEYVFDIGFDRQIFWVIDAKRNVEVFPAFQPIRRRQIIYTVPTLCLPRAEESRVGKKG